MPSPTHIIGLVGTSASGKSHAADYIVRNYGGKHVKFSDYLGRVIEALNLERTKENMIKMSIALRNEFGEETLSHTVWSDASHMSEPLVLVDGIRRVGDLANFKAQKNFKLIGIDADPELRFDRMKSRMGDKTDDAATTWESFLVKESAPTEVTIPEVMRLADYSLENNGSVAELEEKIDAIMKEIGVPKQV